MFVAASILYACGYLFLLWKGAQNDVHFNYIIPPSAKNVKTKVNFLSINIMSKKLHWINTDFLSIEFTTVMYIKKDVKFDNFGLSHIHAMSNKSGYWAVTFPTTYFTTSIKSELTRKIFFVPHAILLYNSTSGIAALLQNSKYFACCLTQKICWTQGRGDLTLHITALLDIWQNIFIKFSKQIANSFSKIINGYKGEFKTLPNISDEAFSASYYWLWSQTRNLATKHLRWSFFQK